MIKKLRQKFVLVIMAVVTVMLVGIFSLVLTMTINDLSRDTQAFIHQIAMDPLGGMRPGGISKPDVRLPYFIVETDLFGQTRIASSNDTLDEQLLEELVTHVTDTGEDGGIIWKYSLCYRLDSGRGGLRITFVDISSQISTASNMVGSCLMIGAGSLAVFFFLSLLLANWIIRPVEEAWQRQKRFVSDASHELKTPLTLITLNAELLAGAEDWAPEEKRKLDCILTGTGRMRTLVEHLLTLARVDGGLPKENMENLDFSRLVSLGALSFEAMAMESRMELNVQVEPGITLRGSGQYLEQLVSILLDNAFKYGRAGGSVTVSLTRESQNCLLRVSNTGDPIPKERLQAIFDRFYRLDDARVAQGSYGLGLSIAKSIAERHGGKIWAQTDQDENIFCVKLSTKGGK